MFSEAFKNFPNAHMKREILPFLFAESSVPGYIIKLLKSDRLISRQMRQIMVVINH